MTAFRSSQFTLGIRQKVLIVLMSVLLFALTISGWFALKQEKENVIAEVDQRGNDIARFVAKSLAYSIVGYDYHTIELLLNEITSSEEVSFAQVVNSRKKEMGIAGIIDNEDMTHIQLFKEPIKLEEKQVGELVLGMSTAKLTERLENNKFSLITREALIIMLIAIGEFIALSYIIIRPVRVITDSIDNGIDENGKLAVNIPVYSHDEFGQLANKFNELGTQLNKANEKLQTKIEAADEQLKTNNAQLLKQQEELKHINEELHRISITDPLTGLYNRRRFEELIETELSLTLRHGDKNSLIMIDIDHFKPINDTHGHVTGDVVLKKVADTLQSQIRKTDVLCRIGGEEFVVLCKRAGKDEAELVAQKLRNAIKNESILIGSDELHISISLGGASIPDAKNTNTINEFYRCADAALYYSKENGRDRYTHFDDMPAKV